MHQWRRDEFPAGVRLLGTVAGSEPFNQDHASEIKTVDAPTYLEQFVEPTIADFEKYPYSRRHAFLACVVAFHTLDYLFPKEAVRRNGRKEFRKESDEFAIVDRVAHAFKHVESGTHKDQHNLPLSVKHVYSHPPARLGVLQCGASRLGDPTGKVALWGEENSDLLPVLKEAGEFLRRKARAV
ncbi:MAG: hypothetical protein J2P49_09025, partial [Methylocapsa sp.]|nr:hypothetical protein [Methylocapsa sp.]